MRDWRARLWWGDNDDGVGFNQRPLYDLIYVKYWLVPGIIMKRIIITGSTGGIGNQISRYLAQNGYEVILFARETTKLFNLSKEIEATNKVLPAFYSLDMGNVVSIEEFDFLKLGRIDGVVLMPPQLDPATDPFAGPEQWRMYFENSFIGPLYFLNRLLPNLRQSERAKIVLISGISSLQVLSHYATSNVLRCAWLAQAKTLAHAFGKESMHFNTLSLGGVLTDMYLKELERDADKGNCSVDSLLNEETANVPLGKYANPLEVAYAVEGLLNKFSDHITGVNIAVDGGFTRAY